MHYLKRTPSQKRIARWQTQRNRLVCKLLEKDPYLPRREALRIANKRMGPMP
jgi:hypothetical protein